MKKIIFAVLFLLSNLIIAQTDTSAVKVPFDGMDLSWINGQNRQKSFPLVFKGHLTAF